MLVLLRVPYHNQSFYHEPIYHSFYLPQPIITINQVPCMDFCCGFRSIKIMANQTLAQGVNRDCNITSISFSRVYFSILPRFNILFSSSSGLFQRSFDQIIHLKFFFQIFKIVHPEVYRSSGGAPVRP